MKYTTSLSILAVLALSCIATSVFGHSAIEPVPRNDQWWKDRHELLNKRAAEAGRKAEVIFIGDSITQGWEGAGKDVWERHYTPRHAVNLGIGGDRTQHVLWRLDNGNLYSLAPKAAVVMIGTNNSNGEDNTPGQIADGVTAIVRKLREKLPETKVLLLAIFPRGENFNAQRGKILQINQVIRKAADGKNVFWADIGHQFLAEDGRIPGDIMPDYLHLSPKGYEIWAKAIERQLARLIGGPASRAQAQPKVNLAGDWLWTMDTPNGPVTSPLVLKVEGNKIIGKFARDETRWLEIENGVLDGNTFKWTVKRDRPDGTVMVYQMTGKIEGDTITATAKTTMDGSETTSEWTARRN